MKYERFTVISIKKKKIVQNLLVGADPHSEHHSFGN